MADVTPVIFSVINCRLFLMEGVTVSSPVTSDRLY